LARSSIVDSPADYSSVAMTSFYELKKQGKLPPTPEGPITLFRCGDPNLQIGDAFGLEAARILHMGMLQQQEQDEAIAESDTKDRLMCDCCQGYAERHEDLTRSGDEILCDECVLW
jgi:hypothetical protein